jgi:scyllo-inositol 2-dehydrogenase (NAD+)
MENTINCGVIGLGRLGYWHAHNIASRVPNTKLVKVCDVDLDKAKLVSKELMVDYFTNNPFEIIEDDHIDAVIIATPTSTHFELLKHASNYGKKIFVEKPLTINIDEAEEICNLFKMNKTTCQVGFMRRFDPAYAEAKKRIQAGDIGEPIYFKGISRDPDSPHEEFIKNSGGIFIDIAIHDFDMARYLMKSEIQYISSNGSVLKHLFMEKYNDADQASSYIEFESGAAGDIEVSRNAYYGYDIRTEIIGTEGTITIGGLRYHNINILTKSGKTHDILPNFPERFKDAYYLEMVHFIESLKTGQKPIVTEIDGLKALKVSIKATESYLEKKKVNSYH